MNGSGLWKVLAAALAIALGALGLLLIIFPAVGSILFGIPADNSEALSYVRALGFRDIALCLWLLALSRRSPPAARLLLGFGVVIPAGDLVLVLLERGLAAPLPLALHAMSGLCLLLLAAWPRDKELPGDRG